MTKKIFLIGLVVMMLAGCQTATHHAEMTEPKTLFTFNDTAFTESFVFEALMTKDTGDVMMNELKNLVANEMREASELDISEALETQIQAVRDQLGDEYESYLTANFGSVEAYIDDVLTPQVFLTEYFRNHLQESDINAVAANLNLKMLHVYLFSDKEAADNVATLLKTMTIEEMESEISPEGSTSLVFTNQNTQFTEGMIQAVTRLRNPLDSTVYHDTDNDYYYVFVQGTDELEEAVIMDTILQQTDYADVELARIFRKDFDFKIFDSRLKSQMEINFPNFAE